MHKRQGLEAAAEWRKELQEEAKKQQKEAAQTSAQQDVAKVPAQGEGEPDRKRQRQRAKTPPNQIFARAAASAASSREADGTEEE